MERFAEKVSFIWSIADLLRGDYKQSEYGRVILPFTLLRRFEQARAGTAGQGLGQSSPSGLPSLLESPGDLAGQLFRYIHGFSVEALRTLQAFGIQRQIERLERSGLLRLLVEKFAAIDLHPERVSNRQMGAIFEELIRKFAESSNETAGEHFTPRDAVRLMAGLLFAGDEEALRQPAVQRSIYDPACGTGGMLSVAERCLAELNPDAQLRVYGQELNPESCAICRADMLIKGRQPSDIKLGNSFIDDGLPKLRADYLISNPPFGVDWTKVQHAVRQEHRERGHAGRFGPGLPRRNDGSLLFLLHMLSKMRPTEQGGSRLAIVFNGSPLFSGAAGSGESEIRRHLLENDLLEAIVALPDQLFYNTGIATYIWLLSNRKAPQRRGRVQLIDGTARYSRLTRSLGDKRKQLDPQHIAHLRRLHREFEEGPESKIFRNQDFFFRRVVVERPLQRDYQASPERLAGLEQERAWRNLGRSRKQGEAAQAQLLAGRRNRDALLRALDRLDPQRRYLSRAAFQEDLDRAVEAEGATLTPALRRAVLAALSQPNPQAELQRDAQGAPRPDPALRDHENVPLEEDLDGYMAREVLPWVPDAWVDERQTRLGCEIPFTRHFYAYEQPRPLEEIEAELRQLEAEIRGKLAQVLA